MGETSWIDWIEQQRSARAAHAGEVYGPARRVSTPAGNGMRSWCYFWPDGEITSDGVARHLPEEDDETRWWSDDKRFPPSTWLPPGPDDAPVAPLMGRVFTVEEATNVLAALAEEGLGVDHEGFVVPLTDDPSFVDPCCTHESECNEPAAHVVGLEFYCTAHAREAGAAVDDATLALPGMEADAIETMLIKLAASDKSKPLTPEDEATIARLLRACTPKRGEP